jgi:small subunit ribosomal protein S6
MYEGLFLFPQSAAADLGGTVDHLKEILRRAEAEVISLAKWDERRLAFDIAGNKRGLYLLAYFRAPTTRLAGLERDCNLSERMLRSLIIRADHIAEETIHAADGRQALEDEIRLRRAEPAAVAEPSRPASSDLDESTGADED